jgi:hypothetical protein
MTICIDLFSIEKADDRRAIYDRFSEKNGHLTEWVQIVKDFLNQAFASGRRAHAKFVGTTGF